MTEQNDRWIHRYHGFDPEEEGLREALCTLGNGYFATRGALEESRADGTHYPGTYLAGGYNRAKTEIAGRTVENEDLVNLPNWLPLSFRPDGGEWFEPGSVEYLEFDQALNLKEGTLERTVRIRDDDGRTTSLRFRRLVHMRAPHLAAIEMRITPENWTGAVEIRSGLDGTVENTGVARYRELTSKHLEVVDTRRCGEEGVLLLTRTLQSDLRIGQSARTRVFSEDRQRLPVERKEPEENGFIGDVLRMEAREGETLLVEKVVSLYTSRDPAISDVGLEATQAIARAPDFPDLIEGHTLAWEHLWRWFDMVLVDKVRTERILRLHIFHLLATASVNTIDLDVGVPARGLHGEAYRGHIFWDEIFIFPFLNLRIPELTRALLKYRFRRLDDARRAADEAGFAGALFPWQSGSDGREETQQLHLNPKSGRWLPDNTHLQRHVNAAIAHNVWTYYEATRDWEFLSFYGAEILLEIARFWGSIATHDEESGRYEILGVMGPDEYHDAYPDADEPGLDNNTYTNVMAAWVLCRALDTLELLGDDRCRELREMMKLGDEEISRWEAISRGMRIVFHEDGVLTQFEGYEALEEFDWKGYRERYGDIHRLDRILEAEGDTPNRYKLSKQADVLMLFYLFSDHELHRVFDRLGYELTDEQIRRTVEYYERRTSHGSTLSRVVHSWVMAREDRAHSWKLFTEALESDVSDVQGGTTQEGIHLGAMAGTVDLVQRCYAGLDVRDDVLWIIPRLPEELPRLRLRIRYRGLWLDLDISDDEFTVTAHEGWAREVTIGTRDAVRRLQAGESFTAAIPRL